MRFLRDGHVRLVALLVVAVAAVVALPAAARAPGPNGQIAFDQCNAVCNGVATPGAYTANPDGSAESLLVAGPVVCCPFWSPDGSKLVVPYLTNDGRIGTGTVNADGSGYTPFTIPDPTLNVGCGPWSPDGKRLACESWDDSNPSRNGIYTISSSNGRGLTRVTANPLGGHDIPASYSPDGTQILFIRFDANFNSVGLFTVRTSDGQVREIVADTRLNIGADWSSQGNIIFSRHVSAHVRGSLWVVQSDGSGLHEINIQGLACGGSLPNPNAFGCHGPWWSPDGKKIIFAANSAATGTNIYTANADGTGLAQVTHDGDDDDPTWGTHPLAG